MNYIKLINGVKMPMIGFGTSPLKGNVLNQSINDSYSIGYHLYDTAYMYQNESDLGEILKRNKIPRSDIFLTSKIQCIQYLGRKRYLYLNKQSVLTAYRRSCKKLKTDYLDLYLLHSPFEGYLKAYKELLKLYENKKVRAIGVCNCNVNRLKEIRSKFGVYPMVDQVELHPYNQQKEVVDFCLEHNIQVEAYSPFGRGKLMEQLMNNQQLINIAKNRNKTVSQIVLKWIVQQQIVVLARSTNRKHIEENLNIFDFELSDSEMLEIVKLDKKEGYSTFARNHPNE